MTPDEIVSHIPSITLAEVHAALAYYFDHIEEIQAEMREECALEENQRRLLTSVPTPHYLDAHRNAVIDDLEGRRL